MISLIKKSLNLLQRRVFTFMKKAFTKKKPHIITKEHHDASSLYFLLSHLFMAKGNLGIAERMCFQASILNPFDQKILDRAKELSKSFVVCSMLLVYSCYFGLRWIRSYV